jgi:hypothetical protein
MDTPQGDRAARELLSRRELLGGGLFLGLLALSGCGSTSSQSSLPSPRWNAPGTSPVYVPPTPAPMPMPAQPAVATGDVPVIPRSAWTNAGPRKSNINPMNGISCITLHHDGMNAFGSTAQSDAARRLDQIRNSHLQRRAKTGEQWADIGYHYIIDPAGRVWEGRSIQYQGAHVQDQNEHNLGILVMGNYDRQQPTAASKATVDAFVAMQMNRYRIPLARVRTHRELAPTECPGDSLQAFMNQTRSRGGRLAMAASSMRLA